jgi:hypothetical protein
MYRIVFRVSSFLLAAFLLFAARGSAQSVAYRQTNLASDVTTPGFANHINGSLRDSWGITALSGLSYLIANPANGRVVFEDSTGLNTTQQFSKLERKRASLLTATAVLALAVTAAAGCGGYGGGSGTPSSRRMVTITVTAQSASVSHTSTLNVTVQ